LAAVPLDAGTNQRNRVDRLQRYDSEIPGKTQCELGCPHTVHVQRRPIEQRGARGSLAANVNTPGPRRLLRFRDRQLDEIDPLPPTRVYFGGGKSVGSPETGSGPGH
jgi:hypothetical protein